MGNNSNIIMYSCMLTMHGYVLQAIGGHLVEFIDGGGGAIIILCKIKRTDNCKNTMNNNSNKVLTLGGY